MTAGEIGRREYRTRVFEVLKKQSENRDEDLRALRGRSAGTNRLPSERDTETESVSVTRTKFFCYCFWLEDDEEAKGKSINKHTGPCPGVQIPLAEPRPPKTRSPVTNQTLYKFQVV